MVAHDRSVPRTGAPGVAGWSALPGARTLLSARFRIAVGLTLTCLAVGLMGFYIGRRVGHPDGQFGIDFMVYQLAATDLAAGVSPYAPSMLAGPIAAQGELCTSTHLPSHSRWRPWPPCRLPPARSSGDSSRLLYASPQCGWQARLAEPEPVWSGPSGRSRQ